MTRAVEIILALASVGALALLEHDVAHPPPRLGRLLLPASYLVALLWIAACVVFWRSSLRSDRGRPQSAPGAAEPSPPDRAARRELVALAGLLLLGVAFRSLRLGELPWGYAGLVLDAAYLSESAFRILDGRQHWSPVVDSLAYVRDAMLPYYLAAFFGLLGRRIEVLRLACNVLAALNWTMVYLILREHSRSAAVPLAVAALYAFSDTDAILSFSGTEYVVLTPWLLSSFLLLRRALRSGTSGDAALAGLVWGLGSMSYVAYLAFGVIPLLIVATGAPRSPRWVATFIVGGMLGALPKVVYLVFSSAQYFARAWDVARHDPHGTFLLWSVFETQFLDTLTLLFRETPHFKWLLMEPPVLARGLVPPLVLGLLVCLRRPLRPVHLWTLGVVAASIGLCVLASPMDYRLTTLMPAVFVAAGLGLAWLDRALDRPPLFALILIAFVGWSVPVSVRRYFDPRSQIVLTSIYAVNEVALARGLAALRPTGNVFVFAPGLTYRTRFLNPQWPDILRLNTGIEGRDQWRSSRRGGWNLENNITTVLDPAVTRAPGGVEVIVDPTSPYARRLVGHLMDDLGGEVSSFTVGDGWVSRVRSYQHVRVAAAKRPLPR